MLALTCLRRFFRSRIDHIIDLSHSLAVLALRMPWQAFEERVAQAFSPKGRAGVATCRIPDDCIEFKRYPLFMARAVLKELIESLQSTQGVKPC